MYAVLVTYYIVIYHIRVCLLEKTGLTGYYTKIIKLIRQSNEMSYDFVSTLTILFIFMINCLNYSKNKSIQI